jgi:hypothetical protein
MLPPWRPTLPVSAITSQIARSLLSLFQNWFGSHAAGGSVLPMLAPM